MGKVDEAIIEARKALRKKLMEDVVSSGLPYGDAIREVNYVATAIQDRGDNLLNMVSIQEVAKQTSRYNNF